MTSHNLEEHLNWFLSAKPFIPAPSAQPQSQDQQRPVENHRDIRNIATDQNHLPPRRTTDNVQQGSRRGGAPGRLPTPHLEEQPSTEINMAKLKTGPSSASKPSIGFRSPQTKGSASPYRPRILKEIGDDNSPSSTPSRKRRTKTIDIHQPSAIARTPVTVSNGDIHTLDLTQARNTQAKNKTKKRKSEEHELDSPSRRLRLKQLQDDRPKTAQKPAIFESIDDFEPHPRGPPSDPPPPYSTIAANAIVVHARTPTPQLPSDEFDSALFDMDDGDEYTVTEVNIRTETRTRMSISRGPSETRGNTAKAPADSTPTRRRLMECLPSRSRSPEKKKMRTRVIHDSEDEEVDLLDQEMPDRPEVLNDHRDQSLCPGSPSKVNYDLKSSPERSPKKSPRESPRARGRENEELRQDNKKPTLVEPGKHTTLNMNNPMSTPEVIGTPISASQSTNTCLPPGQKTQVDRFTQWPDSHLTQLIADARHEADSLQERSIDLMLQGFETSDVHADAEKAEAKANKLKQLQLLSRTHRRKLTRKGELWQIFQKAFEEGNTGDPEQTRENSQLTALLKRMETHIYSALQEASLLDGSGQLIQIPESDRPPSRVMVESTQVSPIDRSRQLSSAGNAQTQFIKQTQMQFDRRSATRKDHNVPNKESRTLPLTDYVRTKTPLERDLFPSDDQENSRYENQIFTHNMGGMMHTVSDNDDNQGDDYGDLDADFFEEAVDFQTENSMPLQYAPERPTFVRPPTPVRNVGRVLSQTSGNRAHQPAPGPSRELQKASSPKKRHPWTTDVHTMLKRKFKMRGFRPQQEDAVNETLAGKDVFVLMPTGGGKSLCYQLPSVVSSGKTRGVTIVVSPLLSLMEDQVTHLRDTFKVQAFFICGESTQEHRNYILRALRDPNVEELVNMLYVTPELLSKSQATVSAMRTLYNNGLLARIVVDEAHCVSQWGHDFRPDYKALGEVRQQFPGVPLMALTATATENVKVDVRHNLGMGDCKTLTQSFNRPGLSYEILPKRGNIMNQTAAIIQEKYPGQCGIVYCLSRKKCEAVAKQLNEKHGIKAHHYHAMMDSAEKSEVQKDWQKDKIHVIVATIAFGMGIDKPDVRFVIHDSIPKSLEGYYQETGRAGRDGKMSGCHMFYGYQDKNILQKMIDEGDGDREQKERQHAMLRKVVQFCENRSDCRRAQILQYFNESFTREQCHKTCDNCNSDSTFETRDFAKYAAAAVRLVEAGTNKATKTFYTLLHFVDVFRGARIKKVTENGHDQLKEFGFGADLDREDLERLFHRLLSEGAFEEHNVVNGSGFASSYIMPGRRAREYRSGHASLELQVRVTPRIASKKVDKLATRKKKTGTGVQKAARAFPLSTNVSSPIQPISRRKKNVRPNVLDDEEDDDFVVRGDEPVQEENEESDFEPIRKPQLRRVAPPKKPAKLGAPITTDERLESLDDIHRDAVQAFVDEAKPLCQAIRRKHDLRNQLFSDTSLREMAIRWPQTLDEMADISGASKDFVHQHGGKVLALIRKFKKNYDEMRDEDVVADPNRRVNVVTISSDEDDDYGSTIDLLSGNEEEEEELDEGPGQTSTYFTAPSQTVAADSFTNVLANFERQAVQSKLTSGNGSKSRAPTERGSGPKKSFRGQGNGRKYSGGYAKKGQGGGKGVSKRAGYSKRTSSGSGGGFTRKPAGNRGAGNGHGRSGGGGGGFAMAPL